MQKGHGISPTRAEFPATSKKELSSFLPQSPNLAFQYGLKTRPTPENNSAPANFTTLVLPAILILSRMKAVIINAI